MSEDRKQQSSPFSTGSGGPNFETRIQSAFTVLMLTGRVAPCLPTFPITKIILQGRYAGFSTDDFVVFVKDPNNGKEAKLLAQIKHDISISARDNTFGEVIQSAWNDFNNDNFHQNTDSIALITGPLSSIDINNVRPVLEWARHSENESEFLAKVNTAKFSSDGKRAKIDAFKAQLKIANKGTDISDQQLWKFLKNFYLIGYDLDTEDGSTLSLIHSLIAQHSDEEVSHLWARIIDAVQFANQNAGTLSLETLPEDIRNAFNTVTSSVWSADVKKLKEHGDFILEGIRTTIGGIHIKQPEKFYELLNLAETSNFIFVTGERGAGKSSLIRDFYDRVNNQTPVFYLRTEDLDKPHLDNVFSAIGLKGSLGELEAGFALTSKKYLVIESFEKILELESSQAFVDLIVFLKKQQGWTVIVTGRDYAYQTIIFNFLQPFGVNFSTLNLNGFDDGQVGELCNQLESLQKLSNKPNLNPLLKSPFFAELAYRVLETGTEFVPQDGEREFQAAVWRNVISKEQERTSGLPLKRKRVFTDIAIARAKQMVYGVPAIEFDSEAVLKLEGDNLIRRDAKNNLLSPAHDVLEDWALEQYIEDAFQKHSSDLQSFLDAVGNEPAINRAYRLWLHQKLRYGENVNDFVLSIINDQSIEKHWQDETVSAILLGDKPDEFLDLLKGQLFINDGELLKRVCFILRIACQAPDTANTKLKGTGEQALVDTLLLKPYGRGWDAIIYFLFGNKDHLSVNLLPHVTAVISDWISIIHIDNDLPALAREAGLLALYVLNHRKESHRDDKDEKKLFGVILKTFPMFHEEFLEFLEKNVFVSKRNWEHRRPHYADEFCEMAFSLIDSAFLCKYDPELLIKLAHFEWSFDLSNEEDKPWYARTNIEVAECFGLHEHRHDFFPASGARGPFRNLLYYHPRKGLDFILDLLNSAAEQYAHSDLDYPKESSNLKIGYSDPLVKQVEIHLNDGSSIKQYCTGRLWSAYRGQTVTPYLLQSALMALENWLIVYIKQFETDSIDWLFDYILRKSNSVLPTAVLASVATGFPEKVGKSAFPLLRTFNLYFLDSARMIQEHIGWIGGGGLYRDVYSEIYAEERRTSANHPWRKEHLEMLIVRLQFSELRSDALSVIDVLRSSAPEDEEIRFLLHRIDSRGWKAVEDKENNQILFEPKQIEPDLESIQKETQEKFQKNNRFSSLSLWARKVYEREKLEREYYKTWRDAFVETKALVEELKTGSLEDLSPMYFGGAVTAATVFIRDHSGELTEEDITWCAELIFSATTINADTNNSLAISDVTDYDGAAAAASVLPVLLDFASSKKEKVLVKRLVATGLTHANEKVRNSTAVGIREHLWQRDAEFAQNCFNGALEYAHFEKTNQVKRWKLPYLEGDKKDDELNRLKTKRGKFREQLAQGKISNTIEVISLKTHSSWHILAPNLMIPNGSKKSSHINLFSQMLTIFFELEDKRHNYLSDEDEKLEVDYRIPLDFTKRFAEYLFLLQEAGYEDLVEQLKTGCDIAPEFINYLVSCIAVEAEKASQEEGYWKFWQRLSIKIQEIAIEIAQHSSEKRYIDDRSKLIRGFLKSDIDWQKIDLENQSISHGKDMILDFVNKAGKNVDVFEALAKLMYYFPSIFFESGVQILAKHQKEEKGIHLLSGVNTAFYLERSIQRYLQLNQTGPLSRKMHESCFVLLDGIVETASSRAYYLREHLIRSRRIF